MASVSPVQALARLSPAVSALRDHSDLPGRTQHRAAHAMDPEEEAEMRDNMLAFAE